MWAIPLNPFLSAGAAQHKYQLAVDSGRQQGVIEVTGQEDLALEEPLDPVWNGTFVQNGGMSEREETVLAYPGW